MGELKMGIQTGLTQYEITTGCGIKQIIGPKQAAGESGRKRSLFAC